MRQSSMSNVINLKFKMENRQPKKQEIPLIEDKSDNFDSTQISIEPIRDQKLDSYLNKIYDQPPSTFLQSNARQIKFGIKEEEMEDDLEQKNRDDGNEASLLKYNRKKKSLAVLTQKFIEKFEGNSPNIIVLDKVTEELQVERRRLYDIINIMESLKVISKSKKNIYEWKGLKKAVETLNNIHHPFDSEEVQKTHKQKSLESLATELLKLISENKKIFSLEEAARIILKQSNFSQVKAKVRRFYDIVNVFKSLKLVQKIKVSKENCGVGKSHYQWLGPEFLQKIIQQNANGGSSLDMMDAEQSSSENSEKCQNISQIPSKNLKLSKKTSQNSIKKSQNQCRQLRDISNNFQIVKKVQTIDTKLQKPQRVYQKKNYENQPTGTRKSFSLFFNQNKSPLEQINQNIKYQNDLFKIEIHQINPSSSYFCNLVKKLYPLDNYTNDDLSKKVMQNLWPENII